LNLVLDLYILQWKEKRIAMSREPDIAGLAWQRGSGNMSHRAPQGGSVDPFQHYHRQLQPRNLNPADQTTSGGGRYLRSGCWLRFRDDHASRTPIAQHSIEIGAGSPLKEPRVHQRVSAITQKQNGAGKQRALRPSQNLPERFLANRDLHLTACSPGRGTAPAR